jgi:hypothetical protein
MRSSNRRSAGLDEERQLNSFRQYDWTVSVGPFYGSADNTCAALKVTGWTGCSLYRSHSRPGIITAKTLKCAWLVEHKHTKQTSIHVAKSVEMSQSLTKSLDGSVERETRDESDGRASCIPRLRSRLLAGASTAQQTLDALSLTRPIDNHLDVCRFRLLLLHSGIFTYRSLCLPVRPCQLGTIYPPFAKSSRHQSSR